MLEHSCSGVGNTCTEELDHCHGSLLVHEDGWTECSDPPCVDLDVARHRLAVLRCEDVVGGCSCTTVELVELLAS